MRRRTTSALLLCLFPLAPGRASAQQWSADVYAGGTRYAALGAQAAADAVALVANLRLESPRVIAFASGAAPLGDESPAWVALGAGFDLSRRLGPLELGAELAGDGFAYRQPDRRTGTGGTVRVQPFVSLSPGQLRVRLFGARSDYVIAESNASLQRHLYEIGARATATTGGTMIEAEAKTLLRSGTSWPFAGVQLSRNFGPAQAWAGAGLWFAEELQEATWNAGASVPIARGYLWASVQHTAEDPLYLSPERTGWNVGFTLPLGGRSSHALAAGPVVRNGEVIVRLERKGRAERGPIAVAGEFNGWSPAMMHAAGDAWELAIPATPGVLRFAFVDAAGEWFVPENYPGRMADDMGGYIVVVVVP